VEENEKLLGIHEAARLRSSPSDLRILTVHRFGIGQA
jgi:hypothetical protein